MHLLTFRKSQRKPLFFFICGSMFSFFCHIQCYFWQSSEVAVVKFLFFLTNKRVSLIFVRQLPNQTEVSRTANCLLLITFWPKTNFVQINIHFTSPILIQKQTKQYLSSSFHVNLNHHHTICCLF